MVKSAVDSDEPKLVGVTSIGKRLGGSGEHCVSVGFVEGVYRAQSGRRIYGEPRLFIKTWHGDERRDVVVEYMSPPVAKDINIATTALVKRMTDWMMFVGDSRLAAEFLVRVLESEDDAALAGADLKRETGARCFSYECYCPCPEASPVLLDVQFDPEPVEIPEVLCPSCKRPMIFESSCAPREGGYGPLELYYRPRPSRDPEMARLKKLFSGGASHVRCAP